jgi:hypothetical protein
LYIFFCIHIASSIRICVGSCIIELRCNAKSIYKKTKQTNALVNDIVTNNTFLLFFFNMCLPYAFHFTYLNISLPTGIHKSPNTCVTCVCLTVNTPFTSYLPQVKHAVYACTCYLLLLFKPVISHCIFLSFSLRNLHYFLFEPA